MLGEFNNTQYLSDIKQIPYLSDAASMLKNTDDEALPIYGAARIDSQTTVNGIRWIHYAFDKARNESIEMTLLQVPTNTFKVYVVFSHGATTVNFKSTLKISAVRWATGSTNTNDTAYGTATKLVCTGGVTNRIYFSALSDAITPGGDTFNIPNMVKLRVERDYDDVDNTMEIDFEVKGIIIIPVV